MYHLSFTIDVFIDIMISYLLIYTINEIKRMYIVFQRRRDYILEAIYLLIKFIWHVILTVTYTFIILYIIIGEEETKKKMYLFLLKITALCYIVTAIF